MAKLTRKDFREAATTIGNIKDYAQRQEERIAYSREAKKINPKFSNVTFKVWVEDIAQAKSDLKRVEKESNKSITKLQEKGKVTSVHIDENIKIVRIDRHTVDINGQRLGTQEALAFVKALAEEFGQSLYTEEELDKAREDDNESNEDAYANGYDTGFDAGHEEAKESHRTIKQYSCARCNQTLTPEHVERLSNIDKPRLDAFDHCNLVFGIYDYNDSCKPLSKEALNK